MLTALIIIAIFFSIVFGIARFMLRSVRNGPRSFLNLLERRNPTLAAKIRDVLYVISEGGRIILGLLIIAIVLAALFG
jgi:hypothetical protein